MAAIDGDWEVTDGSEFGIANNFELPLRRYVKSTLPDGLLAIVARVWGDGTCDYESTARLVAAAPAMLDALRSWMDRYDHDIDTQPYYRDVRDKARAAIAKAEGRNQ
jgi:hypothetical protein